MYDAYYIQRYTFVLLPGDPLTCLRFCLLCILLSLVDDIKNSFFSAHRLFRCLLRGWFARSKLFGPLSFLLFLGSYLFGHFTKRQLNIPC